MKAENGRMLMVKACGSMHTVYTFNVITTQNSNMKDTLKLRVFSLCDEMHHRSASGWER